MQFKCLLSCFKLSLLCFQGQDGLKFFIFTINNPCGSANGLAVTLLSKRQCMHNSVIVHLFNFASLFPVYSV